MDIELPEKIYNGLNRLIQLRNTTIKLVLSSGDKADKTASVNSATTSTLPYELFKDNFGRGEVRLKCKDAKKNKLLIVINNDATARNAFDPSRLRDLDRKLLYVTHKRRFEILLIRGAIKQHDKIMFPNTDIVEHIKTFEQIITNPLDVSFGPRSANIIYNVKKAENKPDESLESLGVNLDSDVTLPTLLRTDPLAFWIGAVPGDVVRVEYPHENVGYVPVDYLTR